jgi:hypothetical protein
MGEGKIRREFPFRPLSRLRERVRERALRISGNLKWNRYMKNPRTGVE